MKIMKGEDFLNIGKLMEFVNNESIQKDDIVSIIRTNRDTYTILYYSEE